MGFADLLAAADRVALATFGEPEPVLYAPDVGAPVSVTGIFDLQYVLAKGAEPSGVSAVGPAVFFRLEDLPEDPTDDDVEMPSVTIGGVVYRATEARTAGMGAIVLVLRRAG